MKPRSIRHYVRGGSALAAATAMVLATAGLASAQEDEYPEPTVSTQVDGNNIITTLTDNGGGTHNGEDIMCVNLGLRAIDALPLAVLDPEDIDFFEILDILEFGEINNPTDADNPQIIVDANETRDAASGVEGELPADVYASIGACLATSNDLAVVSMAYDAPVFVPGGIGSVGQALDLGSGVLELDGGSSILFDAGSEMIGS